MGRTAQTTFLEKNPSCRNCSQRIATTCQLFQGLPQEQRAPSCGVTSIPRQPKTLGQKGPDISVYKGELRCAIFPPDLPLTLAGACFHITVQLLSCCNPACFCFFAKTSIPSYQFTSQTLSLHLL